MGWDSVVVFKTTFNNISDISWWSVFIDGGNRRKSPTCRKSLTMSGIWIHNLKCKSNYHTITTTSATKIFYRLICKISSVCRETYMHIKKMGIMGKNVIHLPVTVDPLPNELLSTTTSYGALPVCAAAWWLGNMSEHRAAGAPVGNISMNANVPANSINCKLFSIDIFYFIKLQKKKKYIYIYINSCNYFVWSFIIFNVQCSHIRDYFPIALYQYLLPHCCRLQIQEYFR